MLSTTSLFDAFFLSMVLGTGAIAAVCLGYDFIRTQRSRPMAKMNKRH